MNHFNNDNRDPRDPRDPRNSRDSRDYIHRKDKDNQSMWLILGLIALVAAALIWYLAYHSRVANQFITPQQTESVLPSEVPADFSESEEVIMNDESVTPSGDLVSDTVASVESEVTEATPILPTELTSTPEVTMPEDVIPADTNLNLESTVTTNSPATNSPTSPLIEEVAELPTSNTINAGERPQ